MWTTVALVAALSMAPGQAGQLTIANAQTTYGFLGSARPDNKFLPGDSFVVTFDIDGVKVDDSGKVLYSMGMEVTNAQGKVQYKQEPRDLEAFVTLGGSRLPASAHVDIGLDLPPGQYTLKVTVIDRAAKASQTLTRTFEVAAKGFGIVRPQFTNPGTAPIPVPPLGVAGQEYVLNFAAIGFSRDAMKKQPNLSVEMRVLDDKGKPTVSKPFTGEVSQDVPADYPAVPMQFLLKLNRAGRFNVELRAKDSVANKTATLTLPITVVEMK